MTIRWCFAIALLVSSAAAALGEMQKPGPKCTLKDWTANTCRNHQKVRCDYRRDEHCKVTSVCFANYAGTEAKC
jgi:hypothetical protein